MKSDDLYKEQKRFFTRFLKENNVYGRYIKYIKNKTYYNGYQTSSEKKHKYWSFDTCAEENGIQNMVSMLITWDRTPEGYDFWHDLSERFKREFRKRFTNI